MPSTDGWTEREAGPGRQICTWRAGMESLVLEPSSRWARGSCALSPPAAQGRGAGQAESKRQQGLSLGAHGGEELGGCGGGYTGLCFESSSCWCRAARWRMEVGLSKGPQECQGLPRHVQTPVHPATSFPSKGRDAQALLSAGLSPRAVASSLKEGRSLGLGAQQRCISLARREGQPSGCGSFVFPDCRPGVKAKSKGQLRRGVILSMRCKEGSISPWGQEQPPQAKPAPCQNGGDMTQPSCPPLPQEKEVGYNTRDGTRHSTYLLGPHHLPVGCRASPHA